MTLKMAGGVSVAAVSAALGAMLYSLSVASDQTVLLVAISFVTFGVVVLTIGLLEQRRTSVESTEIAVAFAVILQQSKLTETESLRMLSQMRDCHLVGRETFTALSKVVSGIEGTPKTITDTEPQHESATVKQEDLELAAEVTARALGQSELNVHRDHATRRG